MEIFLTHHENIFVEIFLPICKYFKNVLLPLQYQITSI